MRAAMTKIKSTFPAALASAHSASSAIGSSTSCTHLGTTVRGGRGSPAADESASSRSSCFGGAAVCPSTLTFLPSCGKYG